jgi:hypothetical protein
MDVHTPMQGIGGTASRVYTGPARHTIQALKQHNVLHKVMQGGRSQPCRCQGRQPGKGVIEA